MMSHILEQELLIVVGLLLIYVEVDAVEIEKAVRQFITSQCPHDKLRFIPVEHATPREVTLWRRPLLQLTRRR